MKEFIEKLIGRLEEAKFLHTQFDGVMPEEVEVVSIGGIKNIVNQLAEEYNNDFCEWYNGKSLYLYRTSCGAQDSYDDSYRYCPYCGKKVIVKKEGMKNE